MRTHTSRNRAALDIKKETHQKLKLTRDLYDFKSFDEMLNALDEAFKKSHTTKIEEFKY